MLITPKYRPRTSQQQHPQQFHFQQQQTSPTTIQATPAYYPSPFENIDIDLDLDLDLDIDLVEGFGDSQDIKSATPSLSSSPLSQYSVLPRSAQSGASTVPTIAIPHKTGPNDDSSQFLGHPDLMQHDSWLGGHFTPKSSRRGNHHRESSLSSLGSAGPASPYSHNISNPHIAVVDPSGDGFHDLHAVGDSAWNYNVIPKSMNHAQDHQLYSSYPRYSVGLDGATDGMPSDTGYVRHRVDRGALLSAPDFPGASRSHPGSVASSTIGGDSPATPSIGEPEDERRRRAVFASVPKLDRTMTDVYNDELFSPNFTITSAPPSQAHLAMSPTNELFAQRLQAANNQHLNVAHGPITTMPRGGSPFRHGSPLAPTLAAAHELAMRQARPQFGPNQQAATDQIGRPGQQAINHVEPATPQTISPKDAILELPETDSDANFPLFSPQEAAEFGAHQLHGALPSQASLDLAYGVRVPQQYPFIARPPTTQEKPLRPQPAEARSIASAGPPAAPSKPLGSAADGGTYTCTYHGCTLRFETPQLLQKHKREGHRQAHGVNAIRKTDNPATSPVLDSQAGPHRCDRINPTTGKPCGTIFSRPYDLTRHEDTIHNARKHKVRCELCTEEKTFSRADALTRHFRVCHPDVEFPGKHRKRGGQ